MYGILSRFPERWVAVRSNMFWDVMPFGPADGHRYSGGTYCLHLQDKRMRQARKQQEVGSRQKVIDERLSLQTAPHYRRQYFSFTTVYTRAVNGPILSQSTLTCNFCDNKPNKNKQTDFVSWVRAWAIPTEQPPLVGEVIANFCG
jgi:hypothetical protein